MIEPDVVIACSIAAVVAIGVAPTLRPQRARTVAAEPGAHRVRRQTRWARRALFVAFLGGVVAAAGPLAAALAASIGWAWRTVRPLLERRRQQREIDREVPDTIERFVLLAQAGLTPRQCLDHLRASAPPATRHAFALVAARLERGEPLADAVLALPGALGAGSASFVETIVSTDRHGLPLAPTLDLLAREARAERQRLDQAAARTLPVKLSFPLVTCTLPSFVLVAVVPAVIAAVSSLGSGAW